MSRTISRRDIQSAMDYADLVEIEDGYGDLSIREDYSGRFMYGDTCFGITCDRISVALKLLVSLTAVLKEDDEEEEDGVEQVMSMVDSAATDSMGRGMILYFPGWKVEG